MKKQMKKFTVKQRNADGHMVVVFECLATNNGTMKRLFNQWLKKQAPANEVVVESEVAQ